MLIDLRSDTITQPTPAMREAIANAQVGDDVLGDDPTVRALEEYVAHLLGKEAAVFMPSGTMTNQVALRTHTEPGDEVIVELYALNHHRERLREDHINAKTLAEGLNQIPGIEVALEAVQTNIVIFYPSSLSAQVLVERLAAKGVAVLAVGSNSIRAVTNLMVNREQIQTALSLIEAAMHNR